MLESNILNLTQSFLINFDKFGLFLFHVSMVKAKKKSRYAATHPFNAFGHHDIKSSNMAVVLITRQILIWEMKRA